MKRFINIRVLTESGICFLAARLPFLSMNPMAVALFALANSKNKNGKVLCVSIYLGILSLGNPGNIIKYTLVFLSILITDKLVINNKKPKKQPTSVVFAAGIITALIGTAGGVFDIGNAIFSSVGEGILVIVLANVISMGLTVLEYAKKDPQLGNEQIVSLVILFISAIGGIPEFAPEKVSVVETGLYMLVIFMAYRYGTLAGAVAGAGAGVAATIRGEDIAFIGVFCLVGMSIGMVREMGKWASILLFVIAGGLTAMIFPGELWDVSTLRAFAGALTVFVCVPSSFITKKYIRENDEDIFIETNYMEQAGKRLHEFSEAFNRLGRLYCKNCGSVPVLSEGNVGEIFQEITNNVCKICSKCEYCWELKYYDTCHQTLDILDKAGDDGIIKKDDIPVGFARKCINFETFMKEIRRQIELSRINTLWKNRFATNRSLIARQMFETGKLINELEKDITIKNRLSIPGEAELISTLSALGVKIRKLALVEKRNARVEVCMNAKVAKGNCVTFEEVSGVIGKVIGDRWRIEEEKEGMMPEEYKNIIFIKDEKYTVITGMARTAKSGETCSGDNYSFIKMNSGKLIMMITDGAGSGQIAYDESETVIEMIEELTMAGFREDIALSLVNSTLLYSKKNDNFSTVDYCVIDLNNGMCEFIKYGAAATFIRKDNSVKVIRNNTIPIGLVPESNPESLAYRLHDSDMIIMMSDGVADCFPGTDKEDYIKNIILASEEKNPNELAHKILNCALGFNMSRAADDMSVLVAGIWDKY